MEQLNTSAQDCFAVEDSPSGVTAAVGAGITTFGFLEFAENRKETAKLLKDKGAIASFCNWQEFPSLLTNIAR